MSSPTSIDSTTRRLISVIAVLSIMGVFLSIYFLRFVPEWKTAYNKRAFVELKSVTESFTQKDEAYRMVVSSHNDTGTKNPGPPVSVETSVCHDPSSGHWDLIYKAAKRVALRKSIDSLMSPLTYGDNDVFDSYLLIVDNRSPNKRPDSVGEIAFNSGQLTMDFQVNIDTLLKKSDGFSLPGISDVNIEGNDYKLFLRPFRLHNYRAIMAGLLSRQHYTQRYESAPFKLITTGGILLLLLLVALPLLKIYIIGPHERITHLDLRTLIGAYFIGPFILFFLFAWNFLEKTQDEEHLKNLTNLAGQLQNNLAAEIHGICSQLKYYDTVYRDSPMVRQDLGRPRYDSAGIHRHDSALHPRIYKQFDLIFWVNSEGRLTGRYALKNFSSIPLVSVQDRDYFQNMKARKAIILPLKDSNRKDSFCLQPTNDKLDGDFTVNLVIPSINGMDQKHPIMLGAAGQPWSVYNTALPPGYGFSIVDASRTIFFDNRGGRHLLSSISDDLTEDSTIAQCIRYRKERFLPSATLHSDRVALLITPLNNLPYVALVHFNLDAADRFQQITLGLSCFFIGAILLLLIFSTACNEWSRSTTGFSGTSPITFDWLRPRPEKENYYRWLLLGIGTLTGVYLFLCFMFERYNHEHEFVLFIISVLFPFYIAIYYYLLREKQSKQPGDFWKRVPLAALAIPLLSILAIMVYLLSGQLERESKGFIVLGQEVFALLIGGFYVLFKPTPRAPATTDPGSAPPPVPPVPLHYYSAAIIAGVTAIVVIPAIGIFAFFYKEETRTILKQGMLDFAKTLNERRNCIAAEKTPPNYYLDGSDSAFLDDLQRRKGVYRIDTTTRDGNPDNDLASPHHLAEMYYALRNFIFSDTTILTYGARPERAGDSTWFFLHTAVDSELLVHTDLYTRNQDRAFLPYAARQSAMKLLFSGAATLDRGNIWLAILAVIVLLMFFFRLTSSLANRIFMLNMLSGFRGGPSSNDPLDPPRTLLGNCPNVLQQMAPQDRENWSAAGILAKEEKYDFIQPYIQYELNYTYKAIWEGLSPREKFVLYDFALDGLANYKTGTTLFNLIRLGVLQVRNGQLQFMTHSFHNFVLDRSEDRIIVQQLKRAKTQGSWQNLKVPFLLIVAATGIFIFITQEAVYQKITGLFTSLGSILPLITQFFGKGNK